MSQLADVLAARSQELLQRWVDAVRQHLAPGGESQTELEDEIPRFLQQLQAVLRQQTATDHTSPEAGTNPVGREHGAQRFRLGFALGELVREYGLLRDLLLDLITEEGLEISLTEVRLLTDFVATAIAEAVEEHARQGELLREQMQRSETWLSTVLQSIAEAVIVTDARDQVVFLNPVAETLTGWTQEAARGEPLARVYPLRAPEPASAPMLVRADGVHVPIEGNTAPLRDARGNLTGTVVIFRDTTEQRRQDEDLRVFKSLVEASDDYIAIVNLKGQIVYLNPAGLRLTGFANLEQARATSLRDMSDASFTETLRREVIPLALAGRSWEGEVPLRSFSTGEVIPQAARTVPIRDPQGRLELLGSINRDIRERKREEAEQRQRSDFEQHLIGIVSHDLRNPLNAISLGLQMLVRREPDARTLQTLVRLQTSTERAVRMVRDLLDFTQARLGGALKISRAPTDVHALVRGVVEENEVTHPTRQIQLEQWGEGQGAFDADRIAQLMGNLLGNALKYSPADSPVTVRGVGEEGQVRLEVHNGGAPIPPEAMARLFHPLQRAVEGTDQASRSVGLGLYIVKQIARAHGGDVHVTSTREAGTTFSVWLPRGV